MGCNFKSETNFILFEVSIGLLAALKMKKFNKSEGALKV